MTDTNVLAREADTGWVFGDDCHLVEDERGERWINAEAYRKRNWRAHTRAAT